MNDVVKGAKIQISLTRNILRVCSKHIQILAPFLTSLTTSAEYFQNREFSPPHFVSRALDLSIYFFQSDYLVTAELVTIIIQRKRSLVFNKQSSQRDVVEQDRVTQREKKTWSYSVPLAV